jgi:hypothetical protein
MTLGLLAGLPVAWRLLRRDAYMEQRQAVRVMKTGALDAGVGKLAEVPGARAGERWDRAGANTHFVAPKEGSGWTSSGTPPFAAGRLLVPWSGSRCGGAVHDGPGRLASTGQRAG